jgi:hypothetical protein
MKNVVYIVLSLVLLTGWTWKPEKVVTFLQDRNGIMYGPNTEVGFTGVLVEKYEKWIYEGFVTVRCLTTSVSETQISTSDKNSKLQDTGLMPSLYLQKSPSLQSFPFFL